MPQDRQLYVKDRDEWRSWLEQNYSTVKEVWLVFLKKQTGKPSIPYDDAVEEAVCFGWIDSLIKKLDEDTYARKFTPRTGKVGWSASNRARAEKMIEQGRMAEAGLRTIEEAKTIGNWIEERGTYDQRRRWEMPSEFADVLAANETARNNFERLAASHRMDYIGWIATAKRSETRIRRAKEAISLLEKNQKLGLK